MKPHFSQLLRQRNYAAAGGFTLTELLIATGLTGIAIALAGFGLMAILRAHRRAEVLSLRRMELNRALDFIADEARTAHRINSKDGVTTTAAQAVAAAGISSSTIGTAILYLEIPLPATTCAGGTSGAIVDKVVYDIRTPHRPQWLGPKVIFRYGRIPDNNGVVDPCSDAISRPLIDFMSSTDIHPTSCTGTGAVPASSSGFGGFNACVEGRKVDLYLVGKLSASESTSPVTTTVFARSSP